MRRFIGLVVVALVVLAGAGSVSAARQETATDLFHGFATTYDPVSGQPAVLDWANPRWDGSVVEMAYWYEAKGRAHGSLPGEFAYREDGIARFEFTGTTLVPLGNSYLSGVYRLVVHGSGQMIEIADRDVRQNNFGFAALRLSDFPRGPVVPPGHVIDPRNGNLPNGGELVYGSFTFNYQGETFVGYATPNFAEFSISITFDR